MGERLEALAAQLAAQIGAIERRLDAELGKFEEQQASVSREVRDTLQQYQQKYFNRRTENSSEPIISRRHACRGPIVDYDYLLAGLFLLQGQTR